MHKASTAASAAVAKVPHSLVNGGPAGHIEMREGTEGESMVKAYEQDRRRRRSSDVDTRPVSDEDDFALGEGEEDDEDQDDEFRYRESRDFK